MRVRFCPLSKRAIIPAAGLSGCRSPSPRGLDPAGWIDARPKALPAKLRCAPRVRENPAGPWTGHPSCYSAAHPATGPSASSNPASAAPTANMPISSGLNSRLLPALGTRHRQRICRDLTPNDNSIQQERRSLAELSAFFLRPWHAGRTPGCARLARQINAKRGLAEEEVLAERERGRGFWPRWGCCRMRKAGKRKPLPFETEGKGWEY